MPTSFLIFTQRQIKPYFIFQEFLVGNAHPTFVPRVYEYHLKVIPVQSVHQHKILARF